MISKFTTQNHGKLK